MSRVHLTTNRELLSILKREIDLEAPCIQPHIVSIWETKLCHAPCLNTHVQSSRVRPPRSFSSTIISAIVRSWFATFQTRVGQDRRRRKTTVRGRAASLVADMLHCGCSIRQLSPEPCEDPPPPGDTFRLAAKHLCLPASHMDRGFRRSKLQQAIFTADSRWNPLPSGPGTWRLVSLGPDALDGTHQLEGRSSSRTPSYSFHWPSNPESCGRDESVVDPQYEVIWPPLHHPDAFNLLDEHHEVCIEHQSQVLFRLQALNEIIRDLIKPGPDSRSDFVLSFASS